MRQDIKTRSEGALRSYLIANTPTFLLRQLQQDPGIRALSKQIPANDLAEEYNAAISIKPTSPLQVAVAMACLCALYQAPQSEPRTTAIQSLSEPNIEWIKFIKHELARKFNASMSHNKIPPAAPTSTAPFGKPQSSNITVGYHYFNDSNEGKEK